MSAPLIELTRVSRRYEAGEEGETFALREIDLTIKSGEVVALIGASGSGKSTLLNILGCLDQPSSGAYRFGGREIADLRPDELARLRRERFGFIFQRYHLLPRLSVLANVEMPAVYAGVSETARRSRAAALLERLGLGDRFCRRPNQLSGGQQQRVSVARALMNGGSVILADEPTGALDTKTGSELMTLLVELNHEGYTLVIATHDPQVAAYAHRTIELTDGRIVSDRCPHANAETQGDVARTEIVVKSIKQTASYGLSWAQIFEAGRMALIALHSHRLRTGLTLLGVVIGIVSVVMMVAVGEAAQRRIDTEFRGVAANYIQIFPGKFAGDPDATQIRTLTNVDVDTLRAQSVVDSASPNMTTAATLRRGGRSGLATVNGVNESFFETSGYELESGRGFTVQDVLAQRAVVVIDVYSKERFFGAQSPIGATINIGKVPSTIIGVSAKNITWDDVKDRSRFVVFMPHTTVAGRLAGHNHLDYILLRFKGGLPIATVETAIDEILQRRHHVKDFWMFNFEERIRQARVLTDSLTALLGAIGAVSLIVGGIGVMNIMLVSVSERAKEIGIRTAVGARRVDIQAQFLIEAIVVCLIGGIIGLGICLGVTMIANHFLPEDWRLSFSTAALAVATLSSVLTGVIFGYAPARNAARLDPVEALARD